MAKTHPLVLDALIVTGNTKAAVKAAGGKSSDLWMLPYDQIHYDPRDNVRPLDMVWAEHLGKLIARNGYDKSEPLHCYVRKVDGKDLVYLWKGQHRYHAIGFAIQAVGDIGLIPVVIIEAKSVNRVDMIFGGLTSNDSKSNSPLDLAEKITELREVHRVDNSTICERLNITDQTIRDVLLLASAPKRLHQLVREGTVAGTLAIQEIRKHGADKALERLEKGVADAKATGKTKVTKRNLEKAAGHKITDIQAKQLLQALQSVLHDPVSGKLSPGTIAGVHAALTPHADLLDALSTRQAAHPIHVPNEHGAFVDCETIRAPITGRYGTHPAEIHLAQPDIGVWIYSISAQIGHCAKTGLPSMRHFDATFPTRGQAIRAAVSEFTALLERPTVKGAKELATVRKWLDKLWTMSDPDWTQETAKEAAQ